MAKSDDVKPQGRPARHAAERLSKNRTFRVRGQLDEQLQAAAAASGRSVSEEIEYRLSRSFEKQDLLPEILTLKFGDTLAKMLMRVGDEEKLVKLAATSVWRRDSGEFDYETYVMFNEAAHLSTPVSREEWEQRLAPPTDEEFEEMKRRHGIVD